MKRNIFLLIIIGLTAWTSQSEAKMLHGHVMGIDGENNKIPLPKATVVWLNTSKGALADANGHFMLESIDGVNKLVVSYTGYEKDTIEITAKNYEGDIEIVLKSNLETEEIEVNAKQPDLIMDKSSIAKTETITQRGLTKAACCNLSESFVTNPSVDVSYTDAVTGAKQIQLLGLQGIYSQLLTEQIPNLRGLAISQGLSYIPGSWMESIQISKGTSSVQTGAESITGQINVEFKKPEDSEPLFLNFYGDDKQRFEANFNGRYFVDDNWSTALLGHGSIFNNQVDGNGDGFLDKPLTSQLNLFNRWLYEGETVESRFGAKVMFDDKKGGQMNYFEGGSDSLYGTRIQTNRYEVFSKVGFLFPETPGQSIGTVVNLIHHDQNTFYGLREYDGIQNSLYASVLFAKEIDEEIKYTIGANFTYDEYDERLNDETLYKNEIVPGTFLEVNYKIDEVLEISPALRIDHHNMYGTYITPRIHMKYSPIDVHTIRISAGKGFRSPQALAENTGLLASSRKLYFDEEIKQEEAWNYGINTSSDFELFEMPVTFNLEFYRTDFINQLIVDTEQDVHAVHFYNLNGKSYANSFQADANVEIFNGFEATVAYRLNDVKTTINGEFIRKPLTSLHKGFLNLAYSTPDDDWKFDFTADVNGGGTMPYTYQNPQEYQREETYPAFVVYNAQITKSFQGWDIYIGAENIGNYKQPNPIIAADDPFGQYFDATMIWGPIIGRMLYLGIRLDLFD